MSEVVTPEHMERANRIKEIMVTHREAEDLINVGAYQRGNSEQIDFAIDHIDRINQLLRQGVNEHFEFDQSVEEMIHLLQATG